MIAGTINGDGSLRVQVTATGEETALAGIMRLVEEAQSSKSSTQMLADRAAGWLFYVALGVAALTAVAWIIAIGFNVDVIARVATVLVIACPHALGLAIPLVVAITTSLGARNGILVRDRLALEARARDRRGHLRQDRHADRRASSASSGMTAAAGGTRTRRWRWPPAIEGDSEHTIARGIRDAAQAKSATLPVPMQRFRGDQGPRRARRARRARRCTSAGRACWKCWSLTPPAEIAAFARRRPASKGQSRGLSGRRIGRSSAAFALADVIRPESKRAVERLHEMGVEVAMLTGDSRGGGAGGGRGAGHRHGTSPRCCPKIRIRR